MKHVFLRDFSGDVPAFQNGEKVSTVPVNYKEGDSVSVRKAEINGETSGDENYDDSRPRYTYWIADGDKVLKISIKEKLLEKSRVFAPVEMFLSGASIVDLPLSVVVESSLSDANFNVREVVKQLLLLEGHLSDPAKFCNDCIRKHFLLAEALAEEAMTLDGNEYWRDFEVDLAETIRGWAERYDNDDLNDLLQEIREFRKELVPHCFSAILN